MLQIAIAPIVILLVYMYVRDKYEKEPYMMLIIGLIIGAIISIPILLVEMNLSRLVFELEIANVAYTSFIIAGVVEEGIKFIFAYFLIYKNINFNEPFDGIVYLTFISLGFALVENILYVTNYGVATGIARGFTSVPVHAMYGIILGYYFGLSKFKERGKERKRHHIFLLYKGLAIVILLHGLYDFAVTDSILSKTYAFIIAMAIMICLSIKMISIHLANSPFRKEKQSV